MMEEALKTCFIHSLTGVFSVLFFLLSAASGLTALLIIKKIGKDHPLYKAIEIRLKFGVAYSAVGTILLLITIILGSMKAGVSNPKAISSFLLFVYASSIPFSGNIKNEKSYSRLAWMLIILGILGLLNTMIGNAFFTSFHDYI